MAEVVSSTHRPRRLGPGGTGAALRLVVGEVLGVPAAGLSDDTELAAIGLDSLHAVELCARLADEFGVDIGLQTLLAGATVADVKRLRELEAENARLKRMYADLALENAAIKDVLSRKR